MLAVLAELGEVVWSDDGGGLGGPPSETFRAGGADAGVGPVPGLVPTLPSNPTNGVEDDKFVGARAGFSSLLVLSGD